MGSFDMAGNGFPHLNHPAAALLMGMGAAAAAGRSPSVGGGPGVGNMMIPGAAASASAAGIGGLMMDGADAMMASHRHPGDGSGTMMAGPAGMGLSRHGIAASNRFAFSHSIHFGL